MRVSYLIRGFIVITTKGRFRLEHVFYKGPSARLFAQSMRDHLPFASAEQKSEFVSSDLFAVI
ncbi:hypothetical protein GGQ85_003095 [Nitrobacter vulgaris]|jgi:hypothetical protein|uniref:Uncharacterized protein n=1 Tax=Nitrobacter vulgaris TaxID=29421 RepID=A0A1V4I0V9_NITVU|nr:hypothetical protein [Nitrobacter vulgaris]OPH83833.1 hypothetical protein B2M20_04805 [Nitrobacter vulgaris]